MILVGKHRAASYYTVSLRRFPGRGGARSTVLPIIPVFDFLETSISGCVLESGTEEVGYSFYNYFTFLLKKNHRSHGVG